MELVIIVSIFVMCVCGGVHHLLWLLNHADPYIYVYDEHGRLVSKYLPEIR